MGRSLVLDGFVNQGFDALILDHQLDVVLVVGRAENSLVGGQLQLQLVEQLDPQVFKESGILFEEVKVLLNC
jgi:hypothetical protein